MRPQFNLTFSTDEIDKASHIRKDKNKIDLLASNSKSLNLIVWQGKILLDWQNETPKICYIPFDHKLLQKANRIAFLGFIEALSPIFLYALPNWENEGKNYENKLRKFVDNEEVTHPYLPLDNRFTDLKKVLINLSSKELSICGMAKSLFEWHDNNKHCSRCGDVNKVFDSGWELSCSKCKNKAFPRTDPVVIMLIERKDSILLGRSSVWPKGMYSCLAGFLEPGERVEDAVRRETFEEVGIKLSSIEYVTNQAWPFPHSLMIGCRATAESSHLQIDYSELEDARWFRKKELISLQENNNFSLKLARKGTIANYLIEEWIKRSE